MFVSLWICCFHSQRGANRHEFQVIFWVDSLGICTLNMHCLGWSCNDPWNHPTKVILYAPFCWHLPCQPLNPHLPVPQIFGTSVTGSLVPDIYRELEDQGNILNPTPRRLQFSHEAFWRCIPGSSDSLCVTKLCQNSPEKPTISKTIRQKFVPYLEDPGMNESSIFWEQRWIFQLLFHQKVGISFVLRKYHHPPYGL